MHIWKCCNLFRFFYHIMVDNMSTYGSAVNYFIFCLMTLTNEHIWKCCNLFRLFHHIMGDDTSIYGSATIYADYFGVAIGH